MSEQLRASELKQPDWSGESDVIRPVFRHPEQADATYRREISETKRLLEIIRLNPQRREELQKDAAKFVQACGLNLNPDELRLLWGRSPEQPINLADDPTLPVTVRRFRAWTREKLAFRTEVRASCTSERPAMAAWRKRQLARCFTEVGPAKYESLIHAPIAFELCRGCSVGCWFCGVGAQKFLGTANYGATKTLWREMLRVVKQVIGEGSRWGFCYWATEPLDNPEYEDFCIDFSEVMGRFPQTTTAIPLRDAGRTRNLLRLSQEKGCELNRFSILSASVLDRVHATFSPEELMYVELLPLNKESGVPKTRSGHARTSRRSQENVVMTEERASTIACVSGFLINLVEQTVRLITPCNATDRWPLGYWEVATAVFKDAEELERHMERMILEHMPIRVAPDRKLAFRHDLNFRNTETISLCSPWMEIAVNGAEHLARLCQCIARGKGQTAEELALELEAEGIPLAHSLYLVQMLFQWGVLDEQPGESALSNPTLEAVIQVMRTEHEVVL